jgi:S-adenosylmethionine:tRNA ribosyltransferase-isomerase
MRVDLFDFDLPDERIALRPAEPRDSARLLVIDPHAEPALGDHAVGELPSFLRAGDALVFNDTKVIPAQLEGVRHREGAGGQQVSATLHMRVGANRWKAFSKPGKRIKVGDRIAFGHGGESCFLGQLDCTVEEKGEGGEVTLAFDLSGPALDEAIDNAGVERHFVTLHVGAGTFLPVKADDTNDHKMHLESGYVSAETAAKLNAVKARGGRIICVGTTSLRLIESATADDGGIRAWAGATGIFITPGYRFKAVDILMTNFHLPRSTLFMLVSAFAGFETMQAAYKHAISTGYRFYSYGDASLLFRKDR